MKQVKINEIQEVHTELTQQIEKLKSSKYKRKPVYVVADQEIDELFVFKTDLDKRFEGIDTNLNKIRIEQGGQDEKIIQKKQFEYSSEKQWLQALENNDNEITQKPFKDLMKQVNQVRKTKRIKNQNVQNNLKEVI